LSGNASLVSEIAESTTYRIIFRPGLLDGFMASVDLFDIEIDNAIESLPIEDIMLACYDSASFPDAACNNFTRDGGNQVRRISKAVFDNSDAEFTRNIQGVDDWTVIDMAVVYAFKENIDFQITVDNLLDEEEPYPAVAADAGIVAYFPGIRGRDLSLSVRARY
tara:strand:+ start:792 stop:1283 length:492 start_codon:yes stop_codon:yes gene_type:complete